LSPRREPVAGFLNRGFLNRKLLESGGGAHFSTPIDPLLVHCRMSLFLRAAAISESRVAALGSRKSQ
jgi:hypothetical protein